MGEFQTKQGVLVEIYQGMVRLAMGGLVVSSQVDKVQALTIQNAYDGDNRFYLAVDEANVFLFLDSLKELEDLAKVLGLEVQKA
ncbi:MULTISPECIES: hypothetical protein [Vibrio]|uniref:Uncharacterized protein n=1 Tax=Vibrio algicola TaxID=2662262 RepID=A0A5Q0TB82_9VIBR|nr:MULTISPECIES: hypothetical protein [Vibrio]MBD1575801.1 hypothetical protein [Vibrio sp. S11_S32]